MGRRKIEIKAIEGKKNRTDTFHKRKVGLVKKAAELSMLCGIKMLLAFEDLSGDVFKYSTHGAFEPQEYFGDAWSSYSAVAKTAYDYPDFFARLYKKRTPIQSAESNRDSIRTETIEKSEDDDSESSGSVSSPEEKVIQNISYIEKDDDQTNPILEIFEDFGRKLSMLRLPQSNAHANEAMEILNTVSLSIDKIKRPHIHKTALFTHIPRPLNTIQRSNRPKTLGPMNKLSDRSHFSSGLNSSINEGAGRLPTLDLENPYPRRGSVLSAFQPNSIIFEEPEFISPINRNSVFPRDFGGGVDESKDNENYGSRQASLADFGTLPSFPNYMPGYPHEITNPSLNAMRQSFSAVPGRTSMSIPPLDVNYNQQGAENPSLRRYPSFGVHNSMNTPYFPPDHKQDVHNVYTQPQFYTSPTPELQRGMSFNRDMSFHADTNGSMSYNNPEVYRGPRSMMFDSQPQNNIRSNSRHSTFNMLLNGMSRVESPLLNQPSQIFNPHSQLEISKNNTKEMWLNISRLDSLALDQSAFMKENQPISQTFENPMNYPKSNSRLGYSNPGSFEDSSSGLLLFSPLPLTSMTALNKAENLDWLTYSLKPQQDQSRNNYNEFPSYSFQSNSSIMRSPRVEKHQKMGNNSFND